MLENELQVYCLKYAESVLEENWIFEGGNKEKEIPISFCIYLIQYGKRNILVDAGCDNMPGFDMKKFYSPTFVLRQIGFCIDDITDVVITHAHHDHIEAVRHFENAVVHISKAEYQRAGHFLLENKNINVFEKDFFLEPHIKIAICGGHSIGSAIVELNIEKGIHIFAGDECYANICIDKKISTGASFDKKSSIQFIEKYSNREYTVHTCHDISLKTERII